MTRVAVHFNDAGITLLDDSQILYREPGFAYLEDKNLTTGIAAFQNARIDPRRIQHRYWAELTTDSLPDRRFSNLSAADLVSRQLEQMMRAARGAELVAAVPAYMNAPNLGLLLGIAGELKLPIVAMVDSAIAATRREYRGAVPVHIDVSLHSTTLVKLSQPGHVQIERTEILNGCGTYGLSDGWLNAVSEAFVQQSRFDPLHTAETEQLLVNRIAGWLSEAAQSDHVNLHIEFRGTTYEARIDSLRLIAAVAPVYEQIASKLRAMFRADEVPAIQITDRAARLPGLAEMLKARVGGEIFVLEAGATARGALARCRDYAGSAEGVTLIRQLPWDQAAVELAQIVEEHIQAGAPTHLLFGNTAHFIGNSPIVIGSEESGTDKFVLLDTEMPGVSRRHCSLKRLKGQCILEDHSRYGTFLNGHRIEGSSALQIGDSVRVGAPGYEFKLIVTDDQSG